MLSFIMFAKIVLRNIITAFCLMISAYASAAVEELLEGPQSLGRVIPAYFKIRTFDPVKWQEFTSAFPGHPIADSLKEHLGSIQLAPLVFDRDAVFACAFIKQKMREKYDQSFRGARMPAPSFSMVDGKGMFSGILAILEASDGDVPGFIAYVEELIAASEKVIAAYNQRLVMIGGNSGLLKHLLGKVFFADGAYTDPTIIPMRMFLLAHDLVLGDDHLFADKKDPTHTLAKSFAKYMEQEGVPGTLVIGCGHSLIADVDETPAYFADDFLKEFTKKTFVHSCQHCLCDHEHQLTVALYEAEPKFDYDGCAHADIAADALAPSFWDALVALKESGKNPIKHIVDHCYLVDGLNSRIHSSLDIGGTFTTYTDYTGKIEGYGFMLNSTKIFGTRTEYTYLKTR